MGRGLELVCEFAFEGFGVYVAGEVIDSDPEKFHLIEVDWGGFAAYNFYYMRLAIERERFCGKDMMAMIEHCFINDISLCDEISRRQKVFHGVGS